MEKTLAGTWSVEGKRGVEPSLVQHALEELRRTIARHQSAWEDSSGPGGGAPADGPASVHGGRPTVGGAASGTAGQRSRGPSSGLTLFDEAGMWRMLRKTSLRNTLCLSFVNIKVGDWVGWWWVGGRAGRHLDGDCSADQKGTGPRLARNSCSQERHGWQGLRSCNPDASNRSH